MYGSEVVGIRYKGGADGLAGWLEELLGLERKGGGFAGGDTTETGANFCKVYVAAGAIKGGFYDIAGWGLQ